jgi:periplasmic divalent cation tolerance protein
MNGCVAVWITVACAEEAARITQVLLDERLAACVQNLGTIASRYWWHGRQESADEVLLTAKTTAVLLDRLVQRVKELHSYEVPEIIAVPILGGNEAYLQWIHASTKVP